MSKDSPKYGPDNPHPLSTKKTELVWEGIEALNKALGPSDALRFLTILHREPTDYVQISRRLYKRQSIDDIFERAKKQ